MVLSPDGLLVQAGLSWIKYDDLFIWQPSVLCAECSSSCQAAWYCTKVCVLSSAAAAAPLLVYGACQLMSPLSKDETGLGSSAYCIFGC